MVARSESQLRTERQKGQGCRLIGKLEELEATT